MSAASRARRRVFVHVGTPKTGTSYVQDVLFRNRARLLQHDVLYAADRFDGHFLAALDLQRLTWGGLEQEAVGAWDALAERVRAHPHTSIISHEILANASRSQAAHALASLGHGAGHEEPEIHVVLSVRDLSRQIPAEWQENVKHRSTITYATFLEQVRDPDRSGRIASWFWAVQEIPDILDRWADALPPERVHLVTVPPPGHVGQVLWSRFLTAFDLDGVDLDLEEASTNPSLGVPETALIRRINAASNREVRPADYRPAVRDLLAHRTLSLRTGSPRLGLPPDQLAWVGGLERSWRAEVEERGYDVVGDLDDLLGVPQTTWTDPDQPSEAAVAEAAVEAIKALLLDGAHQRAEEERLRAELDDTRAALERSYLRPTYRWREKAVGRLQGARSGQRALELYRRARGRSSRSA